MNHHIVAKIHLNHTHHTLRLETNHFDILKRKRLKHLFLDIFKSMYISLISHFSNDIKIIGIKNSFGTALLHICVLPTSGISNQLAAILSNKSKLIWKGICLSLGIVIFALCKIIQFFHS
jgi:hypothetical protein